MRYTELAGEIDELLFLGMNDNYNSIVSLFMIIAFWPTRAASFSH
jgi:hypothetical protein